jgi:hypothetical protein
MPPACRSLETMSLALGCWLMPGRGLVEDDGQERAPVDVAEEVLQVLADAERAEQNLHLDFILSDCRVRMGRHVALRHGEFVRPTSGAIPDRRAYAPPGVHASAWHAGRTEP